MNKLLLVLFITFLVLSFAVSHRVYRGNYKNKLVKSGVSSLYKNNDEGNKHIKYCDKKVIGYYTSWNTKKLQDKHVQRLTHVILAFIKMNEDGSLQVSTGSGGSGSKRERSLVVEKLKNLKILKSKYVHLKTMFAVGGWNNSQYFSKMVRNKDMITNFIQTTLFILDAYDLDGIDIDWEHPVTGGEQEGLPDDRELYVEFMRILRKALDTFKEKKNRSEPYLLSFAGSPNQQTLDKGYDLEKLLEIADWVNVMTYDYFGSWRSQWGQNTGPVAPLFHGAPKGYSGKMNVDYSLKYYACKTKNIDKIVMGLAFYGRFWLNVGQANNSHNDSMWRQATAVDGEYQGGSLPFFRLNKVLNNSFLVQNYHKESVSMYAYYEQHQFFIGYENPLTINEKVKYAGMKNLGGLMIWAVDYDDEELSMLKAINPYDFCIGIDTKEIQYSCSPVKEKRWWTTEDDLNSTTSQQHAGMCGKSAPLYNGYYPICDPDDPGYSCCNNFGYCGDSENCTCDTCVDYYRNSKKAVEEPLKPTQPIRWWLLSDGEGKMGRCGYDAPKIKVGNGSVEEYAICNPDDDFNYCCSNGGYCGIGKDYCECDGCVNFRKNPDYIYPEIKWWTWARSPDNAGRCGPSAPLLDNKTAICNPNSTDAYCCSAYGSCGSSKAYCDCLGCINFKLNPTFRWN